MKHTPTLRLRDPLREAVAAALQPRSNLAAWQRLDALAVDTPRAGKSHLPQTLERVR